jgi:SNF2 family DNA or RNA helicase
MLRRTKQGVVAELPAKTEIVRSVALGAKQAMLYESIRLTMELRVQQAIAEKGLARSHITILDALLKLRQTCCDPRTLPLAEAQKVKESAKLELLMEMIPEMLEEGRRILVFSQFTRMISLIEQELNSLHIPYSKLTGQTRQRDEAIERFKSGKADVFLISLKAGGVGLNLTEADTVIVYDPWWNPAVESQAADRAHRIGQEKPVFVYKLITENTVEEKIINMQDRKRSLADGVYDGENKEATFKLTSEDLRQLFEPLGSL